MKTTKKNAGFGATATTTETLKWNDFTATFADIPHNSVFALAQRGFTHIMGNEIAAYESGLKKKTSEEVGEDDEGNEIKLPLYNDAEIATMVHDRRQAKLKEILDGKLATNTSGPRLPADERILRDIARENIGARFHQLSRAKDMPKASDGKAWDALVDQYLANDRTSAVAKAELERRKAARAEGGDMDDFLDSILTPKAA